MNPCHIKSGNEKWNEFNASLEGGVEFSPFWYYGRSRHSKEPFYILHPRCTIRWEPRVFEYAVISTGTVAAPSFCNEDGCKILKEIQYAPKSVRKIAQSLGLNPDDEKETAGIEEFLNSLVETNLVFKGTEASLSFMTRKKEECTEISQASDKFPVPYPTAPFWTMVYLTYECNVDCKHCGVNRQTCKKSLSGDQWIDVFKRLNNAGVNTLTFNGGEPLFHPDSTKILEYLSKSPFFVRLFTNGTLFDEEKIGILSRGSNNFFLSISLDGANAETHDDFRGRKGTFDRLMHVFDLFNKAPKDIPRYAACVIHKKNLDQLEDVMKLAVEKNLWGVLFISINYVGKIRHSDYYVSVQEHPEILENLRQAAAKYADKLFVSIQGRGPALKELERPIPKYHGSNFVCNAGIIDWMIDPAGDVFPCEAIVPLTNEQQQEFYVGNILKQPISEIWNNEAFNMFRGGYDEENLTACKQCNNFDKCAQKKCRLYVYCGRGDYNGPANECSYIAEDLGIADFFKK